MGVEMVILIIWYVNVFEETEPTALISRVDQIDEIRNVTFTVLWERQVKYFNENGQLEYQKIISNN